MMKYELSRKQCMRIEIANLLKSALYNAKHGDNDSFYLYYSWLEGALGYMVFVGDITKENKRRVIRLLDTIKKRYGVLRLYM